MDVHPLKNLLQLQLGSDRNAILHVPHIISTLDAVALQPSPHTQKWMARINSLVLSKDSGAKWAGLCIAFQTAVYSRDLMMECAQPWVTTALPMLSKNETLPTLKAAIRLLRYIFTSATDVPEFQRQVSTPNVPKFSIALLLLAEKHEAHELKVLAMTTLAHLIPLYPTLHRSQYAALSALSLTFLNGSSPQPVPTPLVEAASRLYSLLHHTGGKVGAASQWRKSIDDTIAFAWGAFHGIRTTFPSQGAPRETPQPPNSDPIIGIPLGVDRLRAAVKVLRELMMTSHSRPVTLPLGSLAQLCVALLRSNGTEEVEGHVDPVIRALELSAIPHIQALGCNLTLSLAECAGHHLAPHCSQLLFYMAHHLEQKYPSALRLTFLRSTTAILEHCIIPQDPLLPSRLARAVLPTVTGVLDTQSDVERGIENQATSGKGRKGKKRARNYEGDEVFKVSKTVICPTKEDGDALIAALDVIRLLLRSGSLSPPVHSISARVILWVYTSLPQIPPLLLSPDPTLHGRVLATVAVTCSEVAIGTTNVASKSLGLVAGTSLESNNSMKVLRDLELLLHPRVPPLIRSMPNIESLSLFRTEESQDELDTRRHLHLGTVDDLNTRPEEQSIPVPNNLPAPTFDPPAPQMSITAPTTRITSFHTHVPGSDLTQKVLSGRTSPPRDTQSLAAGVVELKSNLREQQNLPLNNMTASSGTSSSNPTNTTSSTYTTTAAPVQEFIEKSWVEEDEDEPMPSIDLDSDSD